MTTGLQPAGIHTELHIAVRPGKDGDRVGNTGVVVASAGARNLWEKVDGKWVDAMNFKGSGVSKMDVELFFSPDGRLCAQNGLTVRCEGKAGDRKFETWKLPTPHKLVAGTGSQGVRYAWDEAGRLQVAKLCFTSMARR